MSRIALLNRQIEVASAKPVPPNSFSSGFIGTEAPLSEGGAWRTGQTHGLDWTDPQKAGGNAFGSQTAHSVPPFDDSVAFRAVSYKPNQFCQATLFRGAGAANSQEVELFLLGKISAHSATGIEIDILNNGSRIFIARWNGALNDATALTSEITTNVSISNGAVWYAQVLNGIITVKCNTLIVTTLDITGDSLLTSGGSPGVGFYRDTTAGTPGANDQFCLADYVDGEL